MRSLSPRDAAVVKRPVTPGVGEVHVCAVLPDQILDGRQELVGRVPNAEGSEPEVSSAPRNVDRMGVRRPLGM